MRALWTTSSPPRVSLMSALVVGLGLVAGCDDSTNNPELGIANAFSRSAGQEGAEVDDTDFEAVANRGRALAYQERMLYLADTKGLRRAGSYNAQALLPVASVDKGFNSGQVTYFRWKQEDVGKNGELEPEKARRWLVVPLLMRPDRVLENEQFDDRLASGTADFARVDSVLLVSKAMETQYPGGTWHMHVFLEEHEEKNRRIPQRRVYLFGLDDKSPDLEVVLRAAPRSKKRIDIHSTRILQTAEGRKAQPMESALPVPSPATVARIVADESIGLEVDVVGADGSRWTVHGTTGEVTRVGGPVDR